MKLQQSFGASYPESVVRARISEHLTAAGYRQVGAGPDLVFERGSHLSSWLSFSPKNWFVRATVRTEPDGSQRTRATAEFDVDTTGQIVIRREREYWEKELWGLVGAVGGESAAPAPAHTRADLEARVRAENRVAGGASWFYWIAGLSILNSAIVALGWKWTFLVGLGVTQFVDGVAIGVAQYVGGQGGTIVRLVAFVVDVAVACVFVLFGYLARSRHRWAFVVGMVLYGLDALIFLLFREYWSVAFHALALGGLYGGLKALGELHRMDSLAQPTVQ